MTMACIFPGQGSQSLKMMSAFGSHQAAVRETFEEAGDVLGLDLWRLAQEGPESELNRTDRTQPLMLTAGVAVWRLWRAAGGPVPQSMAGHSLGEYTALVCAGALDFAATVALVADRGRFMQEAVAEGSGAMAAILGLDDDTVAAVCEGVAGDQVVAPVNYNAPGQVVIAGHAAAVHRAVASAKERGAKRALTLPVSVPSHCSLMKPAAERLHLRLSEVTIDPPAIPVIHNVDVATHDVADDIRQALAAQLHHPVRWVDTIRRLYREGVGSAVECGPGKVLAGLNKRIERDMPCLPIHDAESLDKALSAVEP
ncbi:MAG: ACP S-malonyltransferase [Gammaproteobacteria bacterium]|nr:ACP S-malonyltransferase [Gammaproteobacteria bacterium]